MKIDIWSDVVCPFCYIGKANLDAALKEAGVTADIHHKAFRLQPGQTPMLVDDMLAKKYGLTGANAEAQQKRVTDMAAQSGLEFAGTQGKETAMLERLYRAYFTEQKDVLGRDSLLALGAGIGLDRAAMQAALDSNAFAAEVENDQRFANSLNVRGVPFVVIDEKYAISGAQPVAAFLQAIRTAAPAVTTLAEGDACGIDGCD